MHLTRTQVSRRLPVPRKGTKYLARASSHFREGVPVVVALRDMLKLARTSKEVKKMVNDKLIKINGKEVRDIKESLRLFGVLEADKIYEVIILPTGRFKLEETKSTSRFCKIVNKTVLRKNKVQLNLHDGTNIISDKKDKINVGYSVELDFNGKIKNILPIEKGKKVFVISGGSLGLKGKIQKVEGGKVTIEFDGKDKEVELDASHVMVR